MQWKAIRPVGCFVLLFGTASLQTCGGHRYL
jgi:hypothetical protein